MDDITENLLDRHYAMQLRMMGDVYKLCQSEEDFTIGARWMERFGQASRDQKYARNCLMMLMYSQLKELGKLSSPFTKQYNAPRPLDEILEGLQSQDKAERKAHEQEELNDELKHQLVLKLEHFKELQQQNHQQKLSHLPALDMGNNVISDCGDTNSSNSYGCVSSQGNETPPSCSVSNYDRLTLRNHQLIEEISQLHARTLQNEQRCRDADMHWEQKMKQSHMLSPMSHTQRGQALLIKIERGTQQAIRRLKDWSATSGSLNFLATCWQDVLADEPDSRAQLFQLDHKLEQVLDNLLEQAGERREKNVRMLYDQLFEQQQEAIVAKQDALRKEEQALDEARQKLQRQLHDLRHREHHFWQQKQHLVEPDEDEDRSDREREEDCSCKDCETNLSTTTTSSYASDTASVQHNRRNKSTAAGAGDGGGGAGLLSKQHRSTQC